MAQTNYNHFKKTFLNISLAWLSVTGYTLKIQITLFLILQSRRISRIHRGISTG